MGLLIDAMRGDRALDAPIKAAARLSLDRDLDLRLVGDEAQISRKLSTFSYDPSHLMVLDASGNTEESVGSGLNQAMMLLGSPGSDALVTSADGKAVHRAALAHMNLIPGVPRAALCAIYPTARRRGASRDPFSLVLDVGAALNATAAELVGFAHMGSAYASRISRNSSPRVGLLVSNLEFAPEPIREAAALLEQEKGLDFVGGVGGVDIGRGIADVLICPGHIGDMVIDVLRGVPGLVTELIRSAHEPGITGRLAMQVVNREMQSIRSLTDWKGYGGAPLLGFDRAIITTDADGGVEMFQNAIKLAAKTLREDIIGAMRHHFDG